MQSSQKENTDLLRQQNKWFNDLYTFYGYVMRCIEEEEFVNADHIRILANEVMKLVLDNPYYLAVSQSPQTSKSSFITLTLPLWLIFNDPRTKIMIVTSGNHLVQKFGIQIRELVNKIGHNFGIYLADKKQSNDYMMFQDKNGNLFPGSIKIATPGGSITGHDIDWIIIDDPYSGNIDELNSYQLNKKIEWYKLKILQRIKPKTRHILLHTRWSSLDLIGYARKEMNDRFAFVTLPAILPTNKSIWPEMYPLSFWEQKRKEVGDMFFQAVYMQQPIDLSTEFFEISKITANRAIKNFYPIRHVRAWDKAYGKYDASDFTAGALCSANKDGEIMLEDLVYGQFKSRTKSKAKETAIKDGYGVKIGMEFGKNEDGKFLYEEWRDSVFSGYNFQKLTPMISKEDRASKLRRIIYDGKFYINPKIPKSLQQTILNELSSFPSSSSRDDIVDALSWACNMLVGAGGTVTMSSRKIF